MISEKHSIQKNCIYFTYFCIIISNAGSVLFAQPFLSETLSDKDEKSDYYEIESKNDMESEVIENNIEEEKTKTEDTESKESESKEIESEEIESEEIESEEIESKELESREIESEATISEADYTDEETESSSENDLSTSNEASQDEQESTPSDIIKLEPELEVIEDNNLGANPSGNVSMERNISYDTGWNNLIVSTFNSSGCTKLAFGSGTGNVSGNTSISLFNIGNQIPSTISTYTNGAYEGVYGNGWSNLYYNISGDTFTIYAGYEEFGWQANIPTSGLGIPTNAWVSYTNFNIDTSADWLKNIHAEEIDFNNTTISATNWKEAFYNNTYIKKVTFNTLPSGLTTTEKMFQNCTNLTQVNFPSGFAGDSITNMSNMFSSCTSLSSFSLPGGFSGSNLTNMSYMFHGCTGLSSVSLPNSFSASNVENMSYMFSGCTGLSSFSLPSSFSGTNVSNMSYMFNGCTSISSVTFSYSFTGQSVTNVSYMFNNCNSLSNVDFRDFDAKAVTNMSGLFLNCNNLGSIDLTTFNTANVTNMEQMFYNCSSLTTIYVGFDFVTTKVTSSNNMFYNCSNLKGDMETSFSSSHINSSYAKIDGGTSSPGYLSIYYYWYLAAHYTAGDTLHISSVANSAYESTLSLNKGTFTSFNSETGQGWNSSKSNIRYIVIDTDKPIEPRNKKFDYWFAGLNNLRSITNLNHIDISKVTTMQYLFNGCSSLTSLDLSSFNTANVTNMYKAFSGLTSLDTINLSSFNTSNVTNMVEMFRGCTSLTILNLVSFNTANLTSSAFMFSNCSSLTTIFVSNDFVTTSITASTNMFQACNSLVGELNTSFVDKHVTDASYAHIDEGASNPGYFSKAPLYWYLVGTNTLHLSGTEISAYTSASTKGTWTHFDNSTDQGWDAYKSSLTTVVIDDSIVPRSNDMSFIFSGLSNLTTITNINNIDTSAVTNMRNLFSDCSSLTSIDISSFNTANVATMSYMFSNCDNLTTINLGTFDTTALVSADSMFDSCTELTTINVSSNVRSIGTNALTSVDMFKDCDKIRGSAGYPYNSNHIDGLFARVDYGGILPGYFTYNGTTPIYYNNITISFPNNWKTNLLNSTTVTNIYFVNDTAAFPVTLSSPTQEFVLYTDSGIDYYGYKNANSVYIHIKTGINLQATTDFSNAFENLSNLTSITGFDLLNISYIQNMSGMFSNTGFTNLDLSDFNTGIVTNMANMFSNCSALTTLTFGSTFTTNNVTHMNNMFYNCNNLTTIFAVNDFATTSLVDSSNMFANCNSLVGGQETAFSTSHVDSEYARIDVKPATPGYFTSKNNYKAKLNASGGLFSSNSSSQKVEYINGGDSTNSFEIPMRTGYQFDTWQVGGATIHTTWDYTSTKETDVVADWTPNSYTVNYDLNGGSGTFTPINATYDTAFDLTGTKPTLKGYNFTHWTLKGTSQTYSENATNLINLTATNSEIVTLVADWDASEFDLVFDKNAPVSLDPSKTNVVNGNMSELRTKTAAKVTISENKYTLDGYTFIGWATRSCTAVEAENMRDTHSPYIIKDKDDTKTFLSDEDVDVTLYALWTRDKHRLNLKQNEDKALVDDPYVASADIQYDNTYDSSGLFAAKTRLGYTWTNKFTKQRIISPKDRKEYNNDTTKEYVSAMDVFRESKDIDLYPLWLNNEKTVTLETFGGTLTKGFTNYEFTAISDYPYFNNEISGEPRNADGSFVDVIATLSDIYIFDYWSEDANGLNKIDKNTMYDDESVSTIYANYRKRKDYPVTFKPNGGRGSMNSVNAKEGIDWIVPNSSFTKNGYSFDHWVDQHGKKYIPSNPVSVTAPLSLKAIWIKDNTDHGSNGGGGGGGSSGGTITPITPINTPQFSGVIINKNAILNLLSNMSPRVLYNHSVDTALIVDLTAENCDFDFGNNDELQGVRVKSDSLLGKVLLSNIEYSFMYSLIPNDSLHLKIKNGFYHVKYKKIDSYYALDDNGRVLSGFVYSDNKKNYGIKDNALIKISEESNLTIYYFYETEGANKGMLCPISFTRDNIHYEIDEFGRLQSVQQVIGREKPLYDYNMLAIEGNWDYKPNTNNWCFYQLDKDGNRVNIRDGIYKIKNADGKEYIYIFDNDGNMRTGLINYGNSIYYLQEKGENRGAAVTGEVVFDEAIFIFNDNGIMIDMK